MKIDIDIFFTVFFTYESESSRVYSEMSVRHPLLSHQHPDEQHNRLINKRAMAIETCGDKSERPNAKTVLSD